MIAPEPNRTRRILMAGASKVGKTCLLAAIERAVLQNQQGQPRLTILPSRTTEQDQQVAIPRATDIYLPRAAEFFLRGIPFKTSMGPASFDFRLGIEDQEEDFQFADAPGEFTSPSGPVPADRQRLLDECRQGYALVFCFESLTITDPAARLVNLEQNLTRLLTELTMASGRLNFEKILFLLTKIDIPTSVFHDRASRADRPFPMSPLQLAQRLDPLEQMRAIVGSENVAKFFVPGSTCEIGVGVCSAFGFDRSTGQPTVSPYTGLPNMPPGRTREEHYRRWTPFGVREALLFLATGRSSPSVKQVDPAEADFDEVPRVSYIPFQHRP
jgi:hypothetical protein